ncbi:PgPepO oligopeptidase. Metallo peptidase. MEROPS family M13 [Shewanella denitrificans OS217]|jgi:putative endopeptidase|uniref:PgPepO oligopeptidase. Metallo peptidase. MEROPS family M13 n=1 Tax=Shewanella denitrificans (strain OS217 / ATCC BAA-1090 / DSM 15013) TaxID=318161 RepID=Q12Q99_SHEDO|nr:M13-type metalloendopeptidase [Shewanella denitrificans]ABE54377.1 PgPepO oligopeptidase. Metallo peptidase. MEROPS family M13 [Shewanella denitrificans OS217]
MKKLVIGGLCASLIAGLSACSDNKTDVNAATDTVKTATAAAVEKALTSGISFDNIDESVRPQDDFYMYVNGAWMKTAEIPGDRTNIGAFYDLREKARDDVKAIIEEVAAMKDLADGSDEQKVADLYRAFMDVETLNKLGIKPIQGELDKINAIANKTDLVKYFAHSQMKGMGTPMGFYIDVDAKNSSRYAPHIWQYGLSLPEKDFYFNDSERHVGIRAAYLAHIEKMFDLAGFKDGKASANTIMTLETAIAEQHWDLVETRDSTKTYNLYQVKDLATLAPDIDWTAYLTTLGSEKQTDIIINQPSFIQGMNDIVKTTDLATWKAYLSWQLLTHTANNLTEALDAENFEFFSKTLNGQAEQEPRWKRGVATVSATLGEVVGKVYVKRHFVPEAKERMSDLVENLRGAYGSSIDSLDWMSAETKVAAKDKLAKFNPKIGYPNKWADYSKLTIKSDDLVGNAMRAGEVEHAKSLAKLGTPIDKDEWHMTPQTVNAYYNPTMNEIVFPAAILQPPFFSLEADDAVNYGGIGAVIGHEMGHGFDDQGAKFDGEGNMRDWWTESDLKAFTAKGNALITQYSGYQVYDDLNVNGELTLGENIGDLSGVTIAYKAYKMSLDGKEAPVIDGLTGDQRFFMGFTQIWRVKMKEEAMRNRVATDPHSPGHFRALGALSNMPEFYEAYGLKEGDKMYLAPEKRVKIW